MGRLKLSRLSRRFHDSAGRDLILLTIVIALERYADTWRNQARPFAA
jgi:hypothetical protein